MGANCLWLDGSLKSDPYPPLKQPKTACDFAIVGGGFTGLSAAYHFKKRYPGKRVVLIEGARCGYGASGRSGGHLLGANLHAVGRPIDEIAQISRIMKSGIQFAEAITEHSGVPIEHARRDYLVLFHDDNAKRDAVKHLKKFEKVVGQIQIFDKREVSDYLKTSRFAGAIKYADGSMAVNPFQLITGLKKMAEEVGVEIYELTKVISVKEGNPVAIVTQYGELAAETVILGANGYSHLIGWQGNRYIPIVSHVIATAPLSTNELESIGWQRKQLMISTENETYYMQVTHGNRIVIGGGGNYFYGNRINNGPMRESIQTVVDYLYGMWPQIRNKPITHQWAGTLAFTRDALPAYSWLSDHILGALGYSGEGISMALAAGRVLLDLFERKDTELSRVFLVNRTLPYIPVQEPIRYIGVAIGKKLR